MASAEDAAPTAADDSAHIVVAPEEDATVEASAAQEDDTAIGDGLFIERPTPRPDPGNELRSNPAPAAAPSPAVTPAPASAPAAPATSGGAPSAAAQTTAAASAPATLIPARATEVRGVQIERPATATVSSSEGSVALARTGVETEVLTVLAGVLLALGALLVRVSQPRRVTI